MPTIQLQGPSAEKRRHIESVIGSSPPPRYGGSPSKRDGQYASPLSSRLGGRPGLGDDGEEGGKGNADAARDLLLLRESASKKS